MKEKQTIVVIPFVLIIFSATFAVMANHASYKVGGRFFDAQNNLYIPAVFFIAGLWSINLTLKSTHSVYMKLLLIILAFLGIALSAIALYEVVHK
jgi:hypothetical protein